jgi:subtilisin-like proprotein convertase family protein
MAREVDLRTGTLAAFIGLDAEGDWTLTVVDKAGRDVGKLNTWTLTVQL